MTLTKDKSEQPMTFSLTGPCPSTSAGLILKVLGDKTQKKQKQNKQNI